MGKLRHVFEKWSSLCGTCIEMHVCSAMNSSAVNGRKLILNSRKLMQRDEQQRGERLKARSVRGGGKKGKKKRKEKGKKWQKTWEGGER
jgi:hypothetical protein